MHEVVSKPLMQPYFLDNCFLVLGVYSLGGLPVHFKYTSMHSDTSTKILQGTPGAAAWFFHVIWPWRSVLPASPFFRGTLCRVQFLGIKRQFPQALCTHSFAHTGNHLTRWEMQADLGTGKAVQPQITFPISLGFSSVALHSRKLKQLSCKLLGEGGPPTCPAQAAAWPGTSSPLGIPGVSLL